MDKNLLEVFLLSIFVGYENVNLFYEFRNVVFRDWLICLFNWNEFINMLDKLYLYVGIDYVVVFVDVNYFFDINDGLG